MTFDLKGTEQANRLITANVTKMTFPGSIKSPSCSYDAYTYGLGTNDPASCSTTFLQGVWNSDDDHDLPINGLGVYNVYEGHCKRPSGQTGHLLTGPDELAALGGAETSPSSSLILLIQSDGGKRSLRRLLNKVDVFRGR